MLDRTVSNLTLHGGDEEGILGAPRFDETLVFYVHKIAKWPCPFDTFSDFNRGICLTIIRNKTKMILFQTYLFTYIFLLELKTSKEQIEIIQKNIKNHLKR